MTLRTTSTSTSAAVILALTSLVVGGHDADAALTTRCVGEAGAVTVPGDLVVPAGRSCVLRGTVIQGEARVQAGADLLLRDGASISGDLRVMPDGFVDVVGSTIGGRLVGRGLYGARLDGGTVGGAVTVRPDDAFDGVPFVVTSGAVLDGDVDARTGQVILESTTVTGDVTTRGAELTDIADSTIVGSVTVRENRSGAAVCASEIYGNAVYRQNGYGLQLGGNGPLRPCRGATFWGGDLTIDGNAAPDAGIDVSESIVAGRLRGSGNAPTPTGAGNRVRGGSAGQFRDLQPAGRLQVQPQQQRTMAATSTPAGRRGDADERLVARVETAEAAAHAAGPAELAP